MGKKRKKKNKIKLRSIKSSANNKKRDLKGAGQVFKKKKIASHFIYLLLSFFVTSLCFKSVLALSSGKCVVLMHFKSPFFKAQWEYRHRSLAVPLKKVAQSLRAVTALCLAKDIPAEESPSFFTFHSWS